MSDPLVTIVVPVYNIERYVGFCIESILKQTYHNFELILVDDGSKDNSGMICDEYAKKDRRIKAIHQTNRGLSGARNTGMDESCGSLLMFVDGDDIIDEKTIEILMDDYNTDPDILYAACQNQRITSYKLEHIYESSRAIFDAKKINIGLLSGKYENISAWGKLYNKSKIGALRFAEGKIYFEDKTFLFYLLLNNPDAKVSERTDQLYGYYIRQNSITTSKYNEHSQDVLYHSRCILETLREKWPEYLYLGEYYDAVSHLIVLKGIVRSRVYRKEKKDFSRIKKELFSKYGNMNKSSLGRYWSEMIALRVGDPAFLFCVYLYDLVKNLKTKKLRMK